MRLFLGGDLMTGRGIDQILPHPGDPTLHETWAQSALAYVDLAERVHGPIPRPVPFTYVWGDALEVLARAAPDARIVNLETSITRRDAPWPEKPVTYRMHPGNAGCLTAARIDCCALANNHVLDHGTAGLCETLDTLDAVGVRRAGAGRNRSEAWRPAVIEVPGGGRVLVFGFGTESSGIPRSWAATDERPGVALLEDLSEAEAREIESAVRGLKRAGDVAIASIHWGDNWGYRVPASHVRFARRLVAAGIDVVHGHSSHHVRPIEIVAGKLVLYGCGELLDDYEGIGGYEAFRGDLVLLYLPRLDPATGRLVELRMAPMQIRSFRLVRASYDDAARLAEIIMRESPRLGARVVVGDGPELRLAAGAQGG